MSRRASSDGTTEYAEADRQYKGTPRMATAPEAVAASIADAARSAAHGHGHGHLHGHVHGHNHAQDDSSGSTETGSGSGEGAKQEGGKDRRVTYALPDEPPQGF